MKTLPYISIARAAEILACSEYNVRYHVAHGNLRGFVTDCGRHKLLKISDVEKFAKRPRRKQPQ